MGLFVVLGIWKSGGFGLSRWDLGIALPKKILEICVRQFVGFWKIDDLSHLSIQLLQQGQ